MTKLIYQQETYNITGNILQILSAPTRSQRFFYVEVTDTIANETIEHKKLYAQLEQEVLDGKHDYLDKEENKEVQRLIPAMESIIM